VEIEGKGYIMKSKVEGLANDILRVLKIRIPSQILFQKSFNCNKLEGCSESI
jgi:hypothetical protein